MDGRGRCRGAWSCQEIMKRRKGSLKKYFNMEINNHNITAEKGLHVKPFFFSNVKLHVVFLLKVQSPQMTNDLTNHSISLEELS